MTSTEPNVSESGKYSVTETCQILHIHRNTLQHYTDEKLIKAGVRRSNGRKYYTGSEIKRFWTTQ